MHGYNHEDLYLGTMRERNTQQTSSLSQYFHDTDDCYDLCNLLTVTLYKCTVPMPWQAATRTNVCQIYQSSKCGFEINKPPVSIDRFVLTNSQPELNE